MKTYIFQESYDNPTQFNLKAQDLNEAYQIAEWVGLIVISEKPKQDPVDQEFINWSRMTEYQQNFKNWFNRLGE